MHDGFLLFCFKSAAYLMCCSKFSLCSRLKNSHLEVNGDIFVSVISHLNEIPGSKKEERRCMDSLFI
uniref:Uncharacterized protein n=1 Tax=Populus trichocarpa TaxID=3694 RepID=A0A2K2ANB7_POPTR